MFKNAKIYRLTSVGPFWDLEELNDKLAAHAFVPGGQLELQTLGWVPPRENADLAHAVGGKIILRSASNPSCCPARPSTRPRRSGPARSKSSRATNPAASR